jgi:hypothetical protein
MAANLPDPRPVDGRPVHPAASAWYDPADFRVLAFRLPDGMWSNPYGGEFATMTEAIRVARADAAERWPPSAVLASQATHIREVEGNFARAEAAVRELELAARGKDKVAGDLQRDLDSARRMVLLFQWIAVAAIVAGGSLGYALASVGGAP